MIINSLIILLLFIACGIVGIVMISSAYSTKTISLKMTVMHSILAFIGITLLMYCVLTGTNSRYIIIACAVFLIAILVGMFLIYLRTKGIYAISIMLIHSVVGMIGIIFLLVNTI